MKMKNGAAVGGRATPDRILRATAIAIMKKIPEAEDILAFSEAQRKVFQRCLHC